jgi:hypothetical protein
VVHFRDGVIPSAAVFQAERGISLAAALRVGRFLGPLEKTRAVEMTPLETAFFVPGKRVIIKSPCPSTPSSFRCITNGKTLPTSMTA